MLKDIGYGCQTKNLNREWNLIIMAKTANKPAKAKPLKAGRVKNKTENTVPRNWCSRISIQDDFDLDKIIDCGQCFRAKKMDDGVYRFVTGEHILYLKAVSDSDYDISCTEEEWNRIWHPYFDLDRDYASVRQAAESCCTSLIRDAACSGRGIRVLRQDPWEMLITFIISQRKSIPAIAGSVEALCRTFGTRIREDHSYSFPAPEALANAPEELLKSCSLGYRLGYIRDAACKVSSGDLDLGALNELGDDELKEALMSVKGVGVKVANCVSLFGYGRCGCVPVDVWINRAIEQCGEEDPFAAFGENGGIIQQYVFYHMKHTHE